MKKQKLSFKANKYINKHLIKNGKAVISMNIKNNDLFYNDLDADEITLSDYIIEFIDNRIYYISYKYDIVLKFFVKQMSAIERKEIEDMVRAYYGLEANEKTNEVKLNNYKALFLFLMGVSLLALSAVVSKYGFLFKEILSIAGWVALWETVMTVFFHSIQIRMDRYYDIKISNAEIYFFDETEEDKEQ